MYEAADVDVRAEQKLTLRLLVGYRWISLLPPLFWLIASPITTMAVDAWWALALAVALTLLLTLTAGPINRVLLHRPWLLFLDLLLSAALVWHTGAERSPFFAYSLAPILAAAFFFRIRGGFLAAAVYTSCYLPLVFVAPRSVESTVSTASAVGQVISFFLVGASFGYPSQLLRRLRSAHTELADRNAELSQRNRDLALLHELSLVMQTYVDPAELQEYIVRGLVQEMFYRRAVIGLYDAGRDALTGWISMQSVADSSRLPRIAHTDVILLDGDEGPLARAIQTGEPIEVLDGTPASRSPEVSARLVVGSHYIVLPMSLRENPLGIILVDRLPPTEPLSQSDRLSLERLAVHAGVALGSVRLCIDRAQREAITEERTRIAADLHDSLSQTLYGLAYGLDACRQLLPQKPLDVQRALDQLYPTVLEAQTKMRTAIFDMWSDGIGSEAFVARLQRHLRALSPTHPPGLHIDLPGDFDRWEETARSNLYRIAQEALANAAKHADAHQVVVTLTHARDRLEMRVQDDGKGLDQAAVSSPGRFGLQGMAERVQWLGGTLEISGASGAGTTVTVQIPHACAECCVGDH